ncbi:MAG: ABC1 kinase family protein [Bdellovibrionales bacterium]
MTGSAEQAAMLRMALGSLKGPMMKVGQFLALIPDFIPPEYANELESLQAHAPPMGWSFVKRRMSYELGPNWQDKFHSFNQNASFAASLGQVHKAQSLNNKTLACKLQYPDMRSTVEADLRQLKLILSLAARFSGHIETSAVYEELQMRLMEELDYRREAENIKTYQRIFENKDKIHVPYVIDDLSTDRLLVMEWLDGKKLEDIIDTASQEQKNEMARLLFYAWYMPLYQHGVIHGDPHPGNYTFAEDGSLHLLDYGCVRFFEDNVTRAIIMLYEALLENDKDKEVEAYRLWGFNDPCNALIEALNVWARFIYAPMLEDKVQSLHETNSSQKGQETAREVYRRIREIGTVTIPREFVMIDRASVGLGSVFLRLRAELNWHKEFMGVRGQ